MAQHALRATDEQRRLVYLLDAGGTVERRLIEEWIRHAQGTRPSAGYETIALPRTKRRRRPRQQSQLETCLAADDDPLLVPLRVAWFPPPEVKSRRRRLLRLLVLGDPREPGRLRQRVLARRQERYRIVEAEPATVSDLRRRWQEAGAVGGESGGLADFVTRQAYLALERAERRIRGLRYKVPRFVREEILSRASFRAGVAKLARELGQNEATLMVQAGRYLKEIAATHSPHLIDLSAQLIHLLYTRAYGDALHYDRAQLERIYALTQRHPVVFLPSHKSNLDHLVLQYMLHENEHPPNHTAGGINMNFFPVGPLVRRSGVFFIRRTFKDNPLYKLVLRHYVDYLVEKRFSLEWYVEGGRSRSGKLLPPRFGMLAYVVDAYRRGRSEDVHLIPVAIAYEQIPEVREYAAEQRGAAKQRESFSWFVRVVRGLQRRLGDIHINFAEPISLAEALGPPTPHAEPNPDEQSLEIQKLAFQVAVRINRVTPITPISLVAHCLLGVGDRAVTLTEVGRSLANLVVYVHRRQLPTTGDLDLDTPQGIQRTIDLLVAGGVVTCFDEGPEAVYLVAPDQHLAAAYYRNTIIHFFVTGAIGELALLRAAEDDVTDWRGEFWNAAFALRDLLKFEFFFPERDEFRSELAQEVALHDPQWESRLDAGPDAIRGLVRRIRPFNAHRVVRPFLSAYQVVGDVLEASDPTRPIDADAFLGRCMALGKQYQLQRRIRSGESLSRVLFETALRLARNRRLMDPRPDVPEALAAERQAFAEEIRAVLRRVDAIGVLGASRRAGLME
jgi:glycerol-3-phosphate O-acyltransferase